MSEHFDYRSKEEAEIFSYVKNSINTFICGPPGIGKTTLVKSVAEEVNNKLRQAIYVDCSLFNEYRTTMQGPVVDRAYRKYMRRMVNLGLIKSEGKGRWKSYEIVY